MNRNYSSQPGMFDRIHDFAVAGANNELTEDNWSDFERLLQENDDAFRLYIEYMEESDFLQAALNAMPDDETLFADVFPLSKDLAGAVAPTFACGTFNRTIGYFSSGWPVAYLIATVIFVIGALIGSVIYVSHPVQVARQSDPLPSSLSPLPTTVARVTGMVDCVFQGSGARGQGAGDGMQDSPLSSLPSPLIHLGDTFHLASGLLEITYQSGAKVILQGPVAYRVDSADGGFLSVGKLTALVEKRGERKDERGEKVDSGQWTVDSGDPPSAIRHSPYPNPQSLIPNPLFAVRTPTATVTDLGTEFGVEVGKQGDTTSHVFRGSVEVRTTSEEKTAKPTVRVLRANESARVENKTHEAGGKRVIVLPSSAEQVEFVREIPKQKPTAKPSDPFEVVAYWQFDGENFLADASGHGHTLVNHGATQVDGTAAFDGNSILSTVDSIDLSPYRKVRVSWSQKATALKADQVVWEQTENFNNTIGAMGAIQSTRGGIAAISTERDKSLPNNPYAHNLDEYPIAVDAWENFTVEYNLTTDRGDRPAYRASVVKVFKDGKLIGLNTPLEGLAPDSFVNAKFYIGSAGFLFQPGGPQVGAVGFTGQIDNVKIEGMLKSNNNNKKGER